MRFSLRRGLPVALLCIFFVPFVACGGDEGPKAKAPPVTLAGAGGTDDGQGGSDDGEGGSDVGEAGVGGTQGEAGSSAAGAGNGGNAGQNAAGTGGTNAGAAGKGGSAAGTGGGAGTAGAGGTPPATTPKNLRIGNYNAENFFNDTLEKPSSATEKENTPTTEAYHAKLTGVAGALSQLGADIVMLQEIENEGVLADLRDQPEIKGKYTSQVLLRGNDTRGIDIGLISSIPIVKAISHEKESFTNPFDTDVPPHKYYFARDVLEVHFQFNTRHVILLGVHFKAKTGPIADVLAKQVAEATQTRKIADSLSAQDPTAAIVILGDFNNSPSTQPLQIIAGNDPTKYLSATALLSGPDAWTVNFSGKDIYDDQYANPILAKFRVASSATILHLPVAEKPSDHEPVAVTYQVK
jgi:endonuclease/exonuclease/phosphatase family metal-dependent hydrolase